MYFNLGPSKIHEKFYWSPPWNKTSRFVIDEEWRLIQSLPSRYSPSPIFKKTGLLFSKIAMEKIQGSTLNALNKTINIEAIYNEVSNHLTDLHQRGIIHGDLSPTNLLWDEKNKKAYLIDYGTAAKELLKLKNEKIRFYLEIEGTLPYVSSKKLISEQICEQDDFYALSIILLELLQGKPWLSQPILKSCFSGQLRKEEFLSYLNQKIKVTLKDPTLPPYIKKNLEPILKTSA